MKKTYLLLIALVFSFGCASSQPKNEKAHSLVKKHFSSYSKKYKDTDFQKYGVDRVELLSVQRRQKGLADAEAYVFLKDGPVYWVRTTMEKQSFRWKVISWETLGIR